MGLLVFNLVATAQVSKTSTKLNFLLHSRADQDSIFPLLLRADSQLVRKYAREMDFTYEYAAGDICKIRVAFRQIPALIQKPGIHYVEYNPKNYQPLADTMLVRNKIKPVKQGMAPLSQAYNGNGILMGIIDSGIDFSHPDFKNSNGTTRILYLWDQTVPTGTYSPSPFNYGKEWTSAQINASLCTHSDAPYWGHGTHVSGIAAGNAQANGTHEGIASQSDLIVVALNFTSNTTIIADAVQYIFTKANQLNRPCVINASVGDYYGSHDATDLEAKTIENLLQAQPGRVLVGAAGNAGNIKYHCRTQVTGINDTSFTWLKSGQGAFIYLLHADTAQIKQVKYTFGCNRPNYSDIGNLSFFPWNYALNTLKTDTLKNSNNERIGYIKQTSSVNSYGVFELYAEIYQDSLNYLWRVEACGNGMYDAWNFDFQSSNLPSSSQYWRMQKYKMPDTTMTIVSGFQCSPHVITVGNYINKATWYDKNNVLQTANITPGAISPNSSSGPTRTGLLKPDVAATGANIFSCMALTLSSAFNPSQVALGGYHVQGGGTSAASPVVAGVAALYLEKYPTATHTQVKNAITACTFTDNFTGTTPNMLFGWGKLDGMGTMLCSVSSDISENATMLHKTKVYPNPFDRELYIENLPEGEKTLLIFDITGREIYHIHTMEKNYEICKSALSDGLYLLQIIHGRDKKTFKISAY